MLNLARPMRPEDYLAAAWRRKWWIVIPFVLITLGGLIYIDHLPKIYRSSTLILIIPQRVPPDYVRPTVTMSVEQRLSTINTQIMSRTNLGRVIDEMDLQKRTGLSREALIARMRENIEVRLKGVGKKEAFEVFYAGTEPRTVMNVTNRLASLFIEENLKIREQLAEGTADFLSDQLKTVEVRLQEQENAVKQYKIGHLGELPGQTPANLGVLNQLQMQYQRLGDRLTAAEDRRAAFVKEINELKGRSAEEGLESPETVASLKAKLADLRLRYTDKHPDVRMLERKIAELEGGEAALERRGAEAKDALAVARKRKNKMLSDLQEQLTSAEREIGRLKDDEAALQARIDGVEQRIENAPRIEAEMTALTRDYENTKNLYSSLLSKKLESEQAKALEQRQQAEQFRILDPAQLSTTPWKPDVPRLIMMTLVIALGAGCALAFLREYMDRSFKDPEDVKAFAQLPVLAAVPGVKMDKRGRIKESPYGYSKTKKYAKSGY
jgi:polysaccharide chain length determinant protein (PEP-CTERM system associated)